MSDTLIAAEFAEGVVSPLPLGTVVRYKLSHKLKVLFHLHGCKAYRRDFINCGCLTKTFKVVDDSKIFIEKYGFVLPGVYLDGFKKWHVGAKELVIVKLGGENV